MSHSLSVVYCHIVFATKYRQPFLRDRTIRELMHKQLGEISKRLDCQPIIVGGVEDHVHILARQGKTIAQAKWVKELKRVSSIWIKKQGPAYGLFQWQRGYAMFSVSQSKVESVRQYIAHQEEHHRIQELQAEMQMFYMKHNEQFDEHTAWE